MDKLQRNLQHKSSTQKKLFTTSTKVSQIKYSLVVILELNSVSGVQYKNIMIDR